MEKLNEIGNEPIFNNENSSAFPCTDTVNENGRYLPLETGLTKREYTMIHIYQGLLFANKAYVGNCLIDYEALLNVANEATNAILREFETHKG